MQTLAVLTRTFPFFIIMVHNILCFVIRGTRINQYYCDNLLQILVSDPIQSHAIETLNTCSRAQLTSLT